MTKLGTNGKRKHSENLSFNGPEWFLGGCIQKPTTPLVCTMHGSYEPFVIFFILSRKSQRLSQDFFVEPFVFVEKVRREKIGV